MTDTRSDIDSLIEGYRRFRTGDWASERARWAQLAEGQSPKVMIVACSDSRVDPTVIFDTVPGEMFVVRNVANLVPPFEVGGGRHGVSAALEFALNQLKVSKVLVMGHGACGGVGAAMSRAFVDAKPGEGGFIAHWVDLLDEARDRVVAEHGTGAEGVHALELEAVKVSLSNIRTFPGVPEREAAGDLTLEGAYFAIATGKLHILDEATGRFDPVEV